MAQSAAEPLLPGVEDQLDPEALAELAASLESAGVIQPVAEISRAIRARAPGCKVLVDCVQAFTAMPVSMWPYCWLKTLPVLTNWSAAPKRI